MKNSRQKWQSWRLVSMTLGFAFFMTCSFYFDVAIAIKKDAIDDTSNLVESKNLIWQLFKTPVSSLDKKAVLTAKEKFSRKSLTSKFEREILTKPDQIGLEPSQGTQKIANDTHLPGNKPNHNSIINLADQASSNPTTDRSANGTDLPTRKVLSDWGGVTVPMEGAQEGLESGLHRDASGKSALQGNSSSSSVAPFANDQQRDPSPSIRRARPFMSAEDPFRLTDIFHDEHFNKLLSSDSSSFHERENKNLQSFRGLHRIFFPLKEENMKTNSTPLDSSVTEREQSTLTTATVDQHGATTPPTLQNSSVIGSLPVPIYDEISGVLHIDSSIDDILDEFIHPKMTENNDQYLHSINSSYKNLLEPELSIFDQGPYRGNDDAEGDPDDASQTHQSEVTNIIMRPGKLDSTNTTNNQRNGSNLDVEADLTTRKVSSDVFSTTSQTPSQVDHLPTTEPSSGLGESNATTQPDIHKGSASNLTEDTQILSQRLSENVMSEFIGNNNGSKFLIRENVNSKHSTPHEIPTTTDMTHSLNTSNFPPTDYPNSPDDGKFEPPSLSMTTQPMKKNGTTNTTPVVAAKDLGALRRGDNERGSSAMLYRNVSKKQDISMKSGDSENLYYSLFGFNEDRRQSKKRGRLTVETHNKMVLEAQAERMLLVMNQNADPCTDFYEYACGKWSQVYPLEDKALDNTFDRLREGLDEVLRTLLEEQITPADSKATVAAKVLYRGCLNMDEIEEEGTKPLLSLLQELGGWPVLEGSRWRESSFDWVRTMAKLRTYNNDVFLSEWVAADITNSSFHIIQLDQPELGLPSREYFLSPGDESYRKAYLELMLKSCELLGADPFSAITQMLEVIDFEKEIARILTPAEERRNLSAVHKRLTLEQLQQEIPEFNWKDYLEIVAGEYAPRVREVIVFAIEYIKKLVSLVQSTKKRTVSNYLMWRFVKNRISNLGQEALEAKQKFIQILFGSKSQPERWLSCVSYVNGNLGYVVGALFVKKYYPVSSKNDSEEMMNLIRESFTLAIDEASWMHERTREIAIDKVYAMIRNVGYPEYILNDTYMNEIYSKLSFKEDTHFWNVIEMLRFHATSTHRLLSKPVNRKEWTTTPAVVNAYYSRSKNMIMFPAGILQPPFYHPAFPRCLNFGGVGVVIGHEISHGFDDRGRQFDRNGNLQQWWTKEDVSHFYDRATCMLVQYGEYEVSSVGLHINSVNTLSENIADNAGLKIAYKAYQRWKSLHASEDVNLPNISLTHDQLFFLNFGQIWCEVNSPEAMLTKLRGGQHSPNKYRVIGSLANSEEFSQAFHCPPGSPMNPKEKCSVW